MSFGPAVPLLRDFTNGFVSISNVNSLVRQNLTMLVLTNPGERVMDSNYGVGLSQFLFESFTNSTFSNIENKIRQQVSLYMPGVTINRISFIEDQDRNALILGISYSIPNIGLNSSLTITQNGQNGYTFSG